MTDRFELLERIGRGGMGDVWRARDRATGEVVALKVLNAFFASDADYAARFEREVELARRIHSPFVVQLHGYGLRDGLPFITMELVDGRALHEVLRERGKFTWAEALPLIRQIAAGLAAAHEVGVVHRDIKPANILVDRDGNARLTDFGVATAADVTRLTAMSAMLGTPAYMAPEGQRDERSDLYSLGVVLYEMLAGQTPFPAPSHREIVSRQLREDPDLSLVTEEARRACAWLLQRDPNDRPPSAKTLLAVLEGASRVPTRVALRPVWRRWRPVAAGIAPLLAAALVAAGISLALRDAEQLGAGQPSAGLTSTASTELPGASASSIAGEGLRPTGAGEGPASGTGPSEGAGNGAVNLGVTRPASPPATPLDEATLSIVIGVDAREPAVATDITLEPGDLVRYVAHGYWCIEAADPAEEPLRGGPSGVSSGGPAESASLLDESAPPGALIASVGGEEWFYLGEDGAFRTPHRGRLLLACNGCLTGRYEDNVGSVVVSLVLD